MDIEKGKRFQSMLEDLNVTQKQSVLSDDSTLQILAGPGSGKTKVLTCRVAYFVVQKSIPPKNIVVVTFTNKAASEMKKRLAYLIGEPATNELMIGTFHSICCRLLRIHGKSVDVETNFTVADTDMSKSIIERIRKDRALAISDFTRSKRKAGDIFATISKAKSKGETCAYYAKHYGKEFRTADVAKIYTLYEAELKKLNLVDFDNLIIKGCELLRSKSHVLANVEAILVDEYQDTNVVQYDLIKLMTKQDNGKTITIVGDPDQSIYGFRSAEPLNFVKMQKEYTNTAVINMEQNYRSTSTILNAALHVIGHDKSRIDKSLHTDNPAGKSILKIRTSDESAQAYFVAKEIQRIINGSNGLLSYKDFAILMRMNVTSQQFEQAFRVNKIPFTIVGGDRFFNRVEIKDILSYLNFSFNPNDHMSFRRIVNVPKRSIGDANLNKILKLNDSDKTDLLETIRNIGMNEAGSFNKFVRASLLELANICSTAKKMMDDQKTVPNIIRYILNEIKYFDHLKEHYFKDHEARWTNVGELISIAQKSSLDERENFGVYTTEIINVSDDSDDDADNDTSQPIIEIDCDLDTKSKGIETEDHSKLKRTDASSVSITEFLEYCALCSDQKELEEAEGGKVVLATLHASKGLEWPCVFIATCNDGVIPHQRCESTDEECRLLYVGMTRSMFLLYCCSPMERTSWGGIEQETPSRFLNNMDKNLFRTEPHVWDEGMRMMLAETIGRSYPIECNGIESKKRRSTDADDNTIASPESKKLKVFIE